MEDREPGVREDARSFTLLHDEPTEHVAVLFHGYTSSPPQFANIARYLFQKGWNVVVPRLPLHGYKDRQIERLSTLDVAMLMDCVEPTIAFARTLGPRLVIGGFSLGGALALCAAYHHAAQRVVAIAPLLGIAALPAAVHPALARLTLALPNYVCWWNPLLGDRNGPPHCYPQFATHPIARIVLFAHQRLGELQTTAPQTKHAVFGLNAHEMSVNNTIARQFASAWNNHPGCYGEIQMIQGLPRSHDIIEPLAPGDLSARAFPQIVRLFEEPVGLHQCGE